MFVSVLIFIVVLSVLILVHEWGHFMAARRAGLWVEEFGVGIPPRVWGKKIGETIYSINLLPFGGFVRIHGENSEDKVTKPERSFSSKSKKTRATIIIAGVVMNILLGIAAFAIVYTFSGIPRETETVKIVAVDADTPAQTAGVLVGDIVKEFNNESITSTGEFIDELQNIKGDKTLLVVEREVDGEVVEKSISLVPREEYPKDEGPLGVVITNVEIYFPPLWQRPFIGIYYGFKEALFWGKTIILAFAGIIANLFRGEVPRDIAGPVGIFAITSEAAKVGILALINFVGILSINLAILNILPFPALDGGRLAFIAVESVVGRRVVPKAEAVAHTVGFIILILMLIAITAADVRRLIVNGGISGFIDSFLK